MNLNEKKHLYARVIVEIGVGLKPGQIMCAEASVYQKDFMEILAEEAYKAGCSQFVPIWDDNKIDRLSAEYMKENYMNSSQPLSDYYAEKGAAFARLDSPDLEAFAGLDAEILKFKAKGDRNMRKVFREKAKSGHTIACLPGKSWAKLVFPELGENEAMDRLWDAVLACTRCKEEDPVAAWRKFMKDTEERKKALGEKKFICFHYHGGETDFTFSPAESEFWKGGCVEANGTIWAPNVPTEEVFITPHRNKVNGVIASTMPLVYSGQLIDGIRLVVKDGRIVESHAEKGEKLLKTIIETDEGSHYLGEMALIDQSSPIAAMGRVFYTTLYDENASCHVAIGNAYSGDISAEEKDKRGYNVSDVHVDFMIGHDKLCIDGQRPDGTWEPIFADGHWAI